MKGTGMKFQYSWLRRHCSACSKENKLKKPWFSWLCDRSLSNKKEANNLNTIAINHFASYQLSAISRWCVWNEQGSDGNQICLFEKFHQKSKLFYSSYPPNQDQFPRTSNRCQISSELLWCYEYLTCKERSVWLKYVLFVTLLKGIPTILIPDIYCSPFQEVASKI